jgi:hypothetical protein
MNPLILCSLVGSYQRLSPLKVEALGSSETLVTLCRKPEDRNVNLISHVDSDFGHIVFHYISCTFLAS